MNKTEIEELIEEYYLNKEKLKNEKEKSMVENIQELYKFLRQSLYKHYLQ